MKKTLLMGIALMASVAMMGQVPGSNVATRTSDEGVLVLDSIATKNNREKPRAKKQYTYDSQNRKLSEVSISYGSEWAPVPFAPIYGDSLSYTYDDKGLLVKITTYANQAGTSGVNYVEKSRTIYEYNDADRLVKESIAVYNENVEGFLTRDVTEYEYLEDGSLAEKIMSNRPTGSGEGDTTIHPLEPVSKVVYVDFVGVDMPEKIENYTYSKGENEEGTWVLSATYTKISYNSEGLMEKREFWSTRNDEEVVSYMYTYTYNENDDMTMEVYFMPMSGVLKADSRTRYEYDETTGKLSTVIKERASGESWALDETSYYYYNLPEDPTAIRNVDAQNALQVYYNASTKEICVEAEGGINSISIYSANGMEVVRAAVSGERYTRNVSHLEKGLYIVSFVADGRIYSKKIYVNE